MADKTPGVCGVPGRSVDGVVMVSEAVEISDTQRLAWCSRERSMVIWITKGFKAWIANAHGAPVVRSNAPAGVSLLPLSHGLPYMLERSSTAIIMDAPSSGLDLVVDD